MKKCVYRVERINGDWYTNYNGELKKLKQNPDNIKKAIKRLDLIQKIHDKTGAIYDSHYQEFWGYAMYVAENYSELAGVLKAQFEDEAIDELNSGYIDSRFIKSEINYEAINSEIEYILNNYIQVDNVFLVRK